VEGVVTNTDWHGDIADVIIAIWMEKLEPGIFITVDEVQPETEVQPDMLRALFKYSNDGLWKKAPSSINDRVPTSVG
jgi:hypothetical protein